MNRNRIFSLALALVLLLAALPAGAEDIAATGISIRADQRLVQPGETPEITPQPTAPPEVRFSAAAVLPGNSLRDNIGYFYLHVEPGQEQALTVLVTNQGEEDIVLQATIGTAQSSWLPGLIYAPLAGADPTLAHDISTLVTIAEPVFTVPAGESLPVDVLLRVPEEPFEGELLGALLFTYLPRWRQAELGLLPEDEEVEPEGAVRNLYSYQLQLRLREDLTPVEPEFELSGLTARSTASGTTLEMALRNPKPIVVLGASLELSVRDSSGVTVYAYRQDDVAMAPNSVSPFHHEVEPPLPAGAYTLYFTLRFLEESWDFQLPFEIPGN